MVETRDYYDALAGYYKYIDKDWEAGVARQAVVLDSVIREFFGPTARHILDTVCGIGTQSLGLAQFGYVVSASDISAGELQQARAEAAKCGLCIEFSVADMRHLRQVHKQSFDIVIACDNAAPHLLSDEDILRAFQQFYECTRPGGGCLVSVRDYADMKRGGTKFYPRTIHDADGSRIIISTSGSLTEIATT
ncbi:MAG: class I SAM-dependent methyltransferase [Nitrospiraceae bacterium]